MNKTVLLVAYDDGDHGAMTFEKEFNPQKVYEEMKIEKVTSTVVVYHDSHYDEDLEIYVSLYEFGEVDPKFVEFMIDQFMDYDSMKSKNFYIVKE